MPVDASALGRRSRRTPTPSGARRSASTRARSARPTRCTSTSTPPAPRGIRTSSRRRCSPSSTAPAAIEEALFDPEVGIDFAMLAARRRRSSAGGRSCTRATRSRPRSSSPRSPSGSGWRSTASSSRSRNQRGEEVCTRRLDADREAARVSGAFEPGSELAGAARDPRPLGHGPLRRARPATSTRSTSTTSSRARSGCPGRILHGLYTMALRRARPDAGGRRPRASQAARRAVPRHRRSRGGDHDQLDGQRARRRARHGHARPSTQHGRAIIRGATAELEL